MIIFDEREHALGLVKNGFSNFMSLRDMIILVRFWKYMNESSYQARKNLIAFCLKHNPEFNLVIGGEKIDKALSIGKKRPLRIWDDVLVYKIEIDAIRSINDYKCEKILFCMLVVSRVFKTKDSENYYVNTTFGKILTLAKVSGDKQERMRLLKKLNDSGLIRTTLGGSFEIMFAVLDGQTVETTVEDYKKILFYYPIVCDDCGKIIKKKPPKHRFCKKCYKEYRKGEIRESVRKCRVKKESL